MSRKELIFNLVRGSFVDGWGVRTTVFLKGCPLHCKWCCNPEGQRYTPELRIFHQRCNSCGKCVNCCPKQALSVTSEGITCDRAQCDGCGKCLDACPDKALELFGQWMTAREVFEIVKKDQDYYALSGGGLTIGGGEASQFPEFCLELMELCHESGISVAVDTCGYAPRPENFSVLATADLLLYDIKGVDPVQHKKNTGVDNSIIWANLRRLNELGKEIIIRIPVIPGYNDSDNELEEIAHRLVRLEYIRRVDLICYHQYGMVKYQQLERRYPLPDSVMPILPERQKKILALFQRYGLNAQLGG